MAAAETLISATGSSIESSISPEARQAVEYARDLRPVINLLNEFGYGQNAAIDRLGMFRTGEWYPRGEAGYDQVTSVASNLVGGFPESAALRKGVAFEFNPSNTRERGQARDAFMPDREDILSEVFPGLQVEGPYGLIVREFNGCLEEDDRGGHTFERSARTREYIAVLRHSGGFAIATGKHREEPTPVAYGLNAGTTHLDPVPTPIIEVLGANENAITEALQVAVNRVPLREPVSPRYGYGN